MVVQSHDLLLSLSLQSNGKKIRKKRNNQAGFECKTCNRTFATFQALGGHRTSHLRPKVRFNGLDLVIGSEKIRENKRHVCGFCGKEFMTGQALGGHMRLHRTSNYDQNVSVREMDLFDLHKNEVFHEEGLSGDDNWSKPVLLLKLFE